MAKRPTDARVSTALPELLFRSSGAQERVPGPSALELTASMRLRRSGAGREVACRPEDGSLVTIEDDREQPAERVDGDGTPRGWCIEPATPRC